MPPYKQISASLAYRNRQQVADNLRMKSRKMALNRRASNVRRGRPTAAGVTSYQPSLNKQIRALIASKKKDAQDVARDRTGATSTASTCLTVTEGFVGTANSAILAADADEILINTVRLKGYHECPATEDVNNLGHRSTFVRQLLVWFFKPLTVASAGGNLPPITEVLVSDELHSLPVSAASNGGRFVVLSDRTWDLGVFTFTNVAGTGVLSNTGKSKQYFDYTVKVGKTVKFLAPSVTGSFSTQGGHYDSDTAAGQVSRGLLVLYSQVAAGTTVAVVNTVQDSRLNYTG